ncbi:MAG TPA: 4Fe-4S dicluster domain-containing protein [Polyangia bacterium]|nr:4Fe-4S dicluster domain-containing protein [Polyangia bacterium]
MNKEGGQADRSYFGNILQSAKSVLEGMAVTFSYMFRKPITTQYPDRVPVPVADTLPERYRGFLEVDMDICIACKQCERDCPINCIVIDLVKREDGKRGMTRFDIDMGKCMYCGICVEACPIESQSPGDTEVSKCIRMTREFEAATEDFNTLTFRFIRPGDFVIPYKPKKGAGIEPSRRRGEIAREVKRKGQEYNALAARWAIENGAVKKTGGAAELVKDEVVLTRAKELEPIVKSAGSDAQKLEDVLYEHALAQTDCEACGWPTCREYATAMITGKDGEYFKCEPGGAQATRDMNLIFQIRLGKSAEEAAKAAAKVTLEHHK